MTELDKLKQEAKELGITFSPNIGIQSLKEKISTKLDESLPKMKEEKPSKEPTGIQKVIKEAKAKAFKTSKVKITNLDKRDSEYITTAYLGFENLYFDLSRVVPLDTVVELEEGLIRVAKDTKITIHVNDPKTGNKVPKEVNKYSVSNEG